MPERLRSKEYKDLGRGMNKKRIIGNKHFRMFIFIYFY